MDYKLLALTFDDAPPYTTVGDNPTTKIIDAIKKYNGAATFFTLGYAFRNHGTALMQYALDNGFEIANHGNNHCVTAESTADEIRTEITTLQDYVRNNFNGYEMKFFRSSGLNKCDALFEVSKELNMPVIGCKIDTEDWKSDITTDRIKAKFDNAEDGDIILMHAGSSVSEVIEEVCEKLYNDGYRFVTLSDLFRYNNIEYDDIPKDFMIKNIEQVKNSGK